QHWPLHRGYTRGAGGGLIEDAENTGRSGLSLRLCGLYGARLVRIENVPPLVAFRRLAAAAARAHRVAVREAHLEREISAQEIGEIGAVGLDHDSHLILANAQMVE